MTLRTRRMRPLSVKAAELAIAAPQVMAHRMARMALAGPHLSRRDRREFQNMFLEKQVAFGQAWNAMALEAMRANQALLGALLRSFWQPSPARVAAQMRRASLGVLSKGLAPVHRKAMANARRLARTKLR